MSTITLTHPSTQEDWEKLLAFSQLVHPRDNPSLFLHLYRERPDLSPEDHAMLLENGQIVATASLLPHHHYFGDQELEVGELGLMGTHPDRQLQGHARRLVNHWLQVAKERGYPYVYLYGIPNFYERFGFVYAAPSHAYASLMMTREVLEPILSPFRVRPLIASDLALIMDLYDEANCQTPMAEVRSAEYWHYRISHTHRGGFGWWVAVDENNQPQGYVWADLAQGRLREVVARNEEASRAILQWMRWELTERKLPSFTAQVPLDQTFARTARKHGAMVGNPHDIFPGNWGAMVKLLAPMPLIEALRPQLEERIRQSRYAAHEFSVTLVVGDEPISLRWFKDHLVVGPGFMGHEIRMPLNGWTPLLTGYKTVDDLHGVELGEQERALLRTLFPGAHPFIWDLEESDAL